MTKDIHKDLYATVVEFDFSDLSHFNRHFKRVYGSTAYKYNMNYQSINFQDKFIRFSNHWSPRVIAQLNDYEFKLVKVKDEFVWHLHEDADEVFIVIEGEMFVVPQGTEHKPYANEECKVMIIEPSGVINTGATEDRLTDRNDVWI